MTVDVPTFGNIQEVFCDESRPELFVSPSSSAGFSVIGSLWMPASFRPVFKQDIQQLRAEYGVWGEFKWKKVSPSKLLFFRSLVRYFFSHEELRFRAIVVDSKQIDLERFHNADAELGFYKFYYQLLKHWIQPGQKYRLFCDDKVNRDPQRLPVLGRVLRNASMESEISSIEAVDSHQVVAVQLCDILIGATQRRFNMSQGGSNAKATIVSDIESYLHRRIERTYPSEQKFNVFEIRLEASQT